jgi:hypothetical protein
MLMATVAQGSTAFPTAYHVHSFQNRHCLLVDIDNFTDYRPVFE